MGLTKWLEERRRKAEIQKAEQARDIQELQPKLRQARWEGYQQAKLAEARREGRKKAMQPSGGQRVLNILGGLGEASKRMEKSMFPEFSGFPDPFGRPPRKHRKAKGKKGKGKTITIHVR